MARAPARPSREALADEFGVSRIVNVDLRPRYNVAPSENIETIIRVGDEKRLGPMRWGFVPTAAKDPKLAPINARAETLATHRCSETLSDAIDVS